MLGDHHCFCLRDSAFLVYLGLQGLSVAVLDGHDFEVIVAIHVKAFDKVWTVAFIHKSRLRFAQPLLDLLDEFALFVADRFKVHDLDSHLLFCLIIHSFVNLSI